MKNKEIKNGVYGTHIEGIYCEGYFEKNKLFSCFVDFYNSDIEMNIEIINSDNLKWKKVNNY